MNDIEYWLSKIAAEEQYYAQRKYAAQQVANMNAVKAALAKTANYGCTSLHKTAMYKRAALVEFLLRHRNEYTAKDYALLKEASIIQ